MLNFQKKSMVGYSSKFSGLFADVEKCRHERQPMTCHVIDVSRHRVCGLCGGHVHSTCEVLTLHRIRKTNRRVSEITRMYKGSQDEDDVGVEGATHSYSTGSQGFSVKATRTYVRGKVLSSPSRTNVRVVKKWFFLSGISVWSMKNNILIISWNL